MNRPCDGCIDNDATTKIDDNFYCESCDAKNEQTDDAKTIHQWESLNDVFAEGETEIWYMKTSHFRDGINGVAPDPDNLEATHVLLGKIAPCPSGEYRQNQLDEIFAKMQGEFWSQNGEGNTLIQSKGLGHTSMSVGDCIKTTSSVWMVDRFGFKEIK